MHKTYCVSDIHGHVEPLIELLTKVSFDYENDVLISIGDLTDRGHHSWEVLEHLLSIKNFILIEGNHDMWFKEYLSNPYILNENWVECGGKTTLESYRNHNWINIENHQKLLNSSKPYYVENNICFVHGGFDRTKLISQQKTIDLCWDREFVAKMMSCKAKKLKTLDNFDEIFIGHTPTIYWGIYEPVTRGCVNLIDTGCGKGGHLTLWNVYEKSYILSEKKY